MKNIVYKLLKNKERIILTEPLDYLTFVNLMQKSYMILTDSGGIQEEAPSLNIPVLVLRDFTERTEGIESGTIRLIGTRKSNIFKNVALLLSDDKSYLKMSKSKNPYGDGFARKN